MGLKSVPICVKTLKLMSKNGFDFKKENIQKNLVNTLSAKPNFEIDKGIILYLKSQGVDLKKSKVNEKTCEQILKEL